MDSLTSWLKRGSNSSARSAEKRNAAWPLVDRATSDILLAEDWAANLEVADFCNASVDHATLVARALVERLSCSSPKSVKLTLSLIETCVKNGTSCALHALGGTKEFMKFVSEVALGKTAPFTKKGSGSVPQAWLEVQERALEVIQELGQLMQDRPSYPGFYEVYASLLAQGVVFPARESAPAAALAAEPAAFGAFSRTSRSENGLRPTDIDKLEHDLSVLGCKLEVADHLANSEGIYKDSEEILDVLDFLLQCKPRMLTLIEASAQGLLSDSFLESCLQMNDRLHSTADRLEALPQRPDDEVDLGFGVVTDPGTSGARLNNTSGPDASLANPFDPIPFPASKEDRSASLGTAASSSKYGHPAPPPVVPKLRAPRAASASSATSSNAGPTDTEAVSAEIGASRRGRTSSNSSASSYTNLSVTTASKRNDYIGNPFDFFDENDDADDEHHNRKVNEKASPQSEDTLLMPRPKPSENEEETQLLM
mmetsp:Transcript_8128/g.16152  ORF Transcript_8128/g.16152 Transcript_8128/m.16152 type:complete len:483 (+) Transcript_8128:136-1584(+)